MLLDGYKDLLFLFVGDGSKKDDLLEIAQKLELKNVKFVPFQPSERISEVYASADVCLVTLRKGAGFATLPSKIYSILASGCPLIASLDPGSDAWEVVERSKGGICIPPESPEELAQAILMTKSDEGLRRACSENGRDYVQKYHSPEFAATEFEKLLVETLNG